MTDNRGGTATASRAVHPAPIVSPIAARASGQYASTGSLTQHVFTIPAEVQDGDQMVVVTTGSTSGTVVDPAGWTRLDDEVDGDVRSVAFAKTATGGDAGSTLAFQWSSPTKATISFAAYSGVAGVAATVGSTEPSTTGVAAHTTPGVSVAMDGAWVLSYWADKDTATTGWTAPADQVVRSAPAVVEVAGTQRVTALLTDDGAPVAGGARPGQTATADAPASKGTFFTIVLGPVGGPST